MNAALRRACLALALASAAAGAQETGRPDLPSLPPSEIKALPADGSPASLPPVSGQMYRLGGRTELQPLLSISLGDPFYRTYAIGARVEQHFGEHWSVAFHALVGASAIAAPIAVCGGEACSGPTRDALRTAPGSIQIFLGPDVTWTPIYGKLSLFGEKTLHFNVFASLGPELLRERLAQDPTEAIAARWAPGGRFALGERVFISDRLSTRIAVSELVYGSRVRSRIEIERKLSVEAGITLLLGGGR